MAEKSPFLNHFDSQTVKKSKFRVFFPHVLTESVEEHSYNLLESVS